MSHWQPGQPIQGGKYIIESILGYGGSGITYRAKDQLTGKEVAIKTLNALMQGRPDFSKHQERFVQEAFRLAKCNNSHVIEVNNICQEGNLWCMVMEYIPGGNLRQYISFKGALSEEEALCYIFQIGAALSYVHQQGFLHRDVKPANIMLRKNTLEAVLIDFGLAREFVQDEIQVHTNSRTESFAPIEQYERRAKRGAYTDVYALAATIYYATTLQLPFPAQFRQQGVNLIPPKQYNPNLSERSNMAILKGMEILPQDRPQSVLEWLELFKSKNPIEITTSGKIQPPPPISTLSLGPVIHPLEPRQNLSTSIGRSQFSRTLLPKESISNLFVNTSTPLSNPSLDYSTLTELLTNNNWKEADRETARIILKLAKREKEGWLDNNHVEKLACEELKNLDQLWIEYSKKHFGFSVQRNIYREIGGGKIHKAEIWRTFGDKVGWRRRNAWLPYKDLIFSTRAPKGHLPMLGMYLWGFTGWLTVLMNHLDECGF